MRQTPASYARDLHSVLLRTGRETRPAVIRAFLADLARKRKGALKQRIVAAFEWIALAAEGRRSGMIVSARPLDERSRERLAKKFPDVVFEEAVDPDLMGGAIVEIEDTRYDGSVLTRLKKLKQTLTNQ